MSESTMSNALDADVLIVGYGPVGQTAAALLAGRGHRVAVYERFADLYDLPRAIYFDDEIMQVWQALGIVDQLDILPVAGYEWFGADGEIDRAPGASGARALGLGIRLHLPPAVPGAGAATGRCGRCPRPRCTGAGARRRSSTRATTSR